MRWFGLVLAVTLALQACAPRALTQADRAALAAPDPAVRAQVEALMPVAMAELDPMEARILAQGRALTPLEMGYARKAGVRHPEKVRILPWHGEFPAPQNKEFAKLYNPKAALAVTFGYGIAARRDDPYIIAHELVHVAQYERLGGRAAFTRAYLTQMLVLDMYAIPLEREAFKKGNAIAPVPQGATRRWIDSLD